jgi:hypothetical protein
VALRDDLEHFQKRVGAVRKSINTLKTSRISRKSIQTESASIARYWLTDLADRLRDNTSVDPAEIEAMSTLMERLHKISSPNNLVSSYRDVLKGASAKFQQRFISPILLNPVQQRPLASSLQALIDHLTDVNEISYLKEAAGCYQHGFSRGPIVLGWCATIDRIQRVVINHGLEKFNAASEKLKNKTAGRAKHWNKAFNVSNIAELQAVFDTDLLFVLVELGYLDSNQESRLRDCFQYRNQSAHPGDAPIDDPHLTVFFTDIMQIIFRNPKFQQT